MCPVASVKKTRKQSAWITLAAPPPWLLLGAHSEVQLKSPERRGKQTEAGVQPEAPAATLLG